MKRFMNKKVVALAAAVGLTLGVGGAAFAFFTSTGSGTGTGSVGLASQWSVGPVVLAGTTIYPGQGSNAIVSDTVKNVASGNQGLGQLQVSITSVSESATGHSFDASESGNLCSTADFALTATGGSNWTVAAGAESATVTTLTSSTDITAGNWYTDASGNANATANALPTGLALTMIDAAHAQDTCQGATVTLTLAAS